MRYFFGAEADDDIDVIVRKMNVIESAEIHELNKNISIFPEGKIVPGWDGMGMSIFPEGKIVPNRECQSI